MASPRPHVVLLLAALTAGHLVHATVRPVRPASPWAYYCKEGVCIKTSLDDQDGVINPFKKTTMNTCKLTCGSAGVLWPIPKEVTMGKDVHLFQHYNVLSNINAPAEVKPLLQEAFKIFTENLHKYQIVLQNNPPQEIGSPEHDSQNHILRVNIHVLTNESHISLSTNEFYALKVTSNHSQSVADISAENFFGARHGLETLSQMVDYHETGNSLQIIDNATVVDSPAFPYRGLLLDTSRNYFSVASIKRTLEAMAANKLNTFHWHITDTHSFPLHMESMPDMTYYGAYSPRQIYYPADVKELVDYGRVRGIRVMPEFDAPAHVGHGWQWGEKQGLGNLTVCLDKEPWQQYCVEPPCGQLNLANPNIYSILGKVYKEMIDAFGPIDLFHYGGDEVNLNCWNTSNEITTWMDQNGFGRDADAYYKQWSVFQEKARVLLTEVNGGKEVPGILWTSHLTEKNRTDKYLDKNKYIIQIWSTGKDELIAELLTKGFKVIFSNYDAWYLDCGFGAWVGRGNNWCAPYKGWKTVYENSPVNIAVNLTGQANLDLILGGEGALWSEQVDETSLDSRLWPRTSAIAERLWSNPSTNWQVAESRMIHHRLRLVLRGIGADRLQPEWCHQNEGLCYL